MLVVPTATPAAFMPVKDSAPAHVTDQVSGPSLGWRCTATTKSKSVGFRSHVCPTMTSPERDKPGGTSSDVQPSSVLLLGKSSTSRTSVMLVEPYKASALTPAASAIPAFSAAPSGSQRS